MDILDLMQDDNCGYISVRKPLIHAFGLHGATIVCELIGERRYWKKRGIIKSGSFFFSTVENLERQTGLSKYQQSEELKKLSELGVLETIVRGNPPKRYIKINDSVVYQYYEKYKDSVPDMHDLYDKTEVTEIESKENGKSKNLTFNSQETRQLKVEKLDTNKNKEKRIINENKESITLTSNTKESRKGSIDFDSIIDSLVTDDRLKSTIKEFIETRKAIKHPFKTEKGFAGTIKEALKLADNDTETAIAIFEQSIRNEYQGVFPLKNKQSYSRQSYSRQKDESWDDIIAEINNGTYVPPVV